MNDPLVLEGKLADGALRSTPKEDLTPCAALGCIIYSCHCAEGCFGCTQEAECLCIRSSCVGCKPVRDDQKTGSKQDICFTCSESTGECMDHLACCSGIQGCCCLDSRFALPCSEEVPCIFSLFGLTLCYKYGCAVHCCAKIGAMEAKKNGGAAPSYGGQQSMAR